jgi:hypothetical protein
MNHIPMTRSVFLLAAILTISGEWAFAFEDDSTKTFVRKTTDFTITGTGNAPNWNFTDWINMTRQEYSTPKKLSTQVKILYSERGIYFLFRCEDEKITASLEQDFAPLFREDVIEVFIQPDRSLPVYLEYELSPLDFEVVILVHNRDGKTSAWRPWHYEGKQRTQHATSVEGGEKKGHATIKSWTAEIFMPYQLLGSLSGEPPRPGI